MKIKGVIFDLDNTLLDFMRMKEEAVNAAIYEMIDAGLNMPFEEAKKKIYEIYKREGIEYQRVFDKFLKETMKKIDYKIQTAAILGYRRAREGTLALYPRVNYTLIQLIKRGLKLGVVSDAPKPQVWLRLSTLHLQNMFDAVVTFDDTRKRKPAPEPFKLILKLLKLEPQNCIMVGDWAERDIVGAKLLGMITVFAKYGDTFGTTNPQADYVINNIQELLDIIDSLNKK